jgi:hypothetical protein
MNDHDWSWTVKQLRKFGTVPARVHHCNFATLEILNLLAEQLLPDENLLDGWIAVRDIADRPVVRRGIFYFMKALGLGADASRMLQGGTDGVSPCFDPRSSYAECFKKWTNKALQEMDEDKAAAILKASDKKKITSAELSAIAVLKGLGMDEQGAMTFVKDRSRHQLVQEALRTHVAKKNYFTLHEELSSVRSALPVTIVNAPIVAILPDPLDGVIPPPPSTIVAKSVMIVTASIPTAPTGLQQQQQQEEQQQQQQQQPQQPIQDLTEEVVKQLAKKEKAKERKAKSRRNLLLQNPDEETNKAKKHRQDYKTRERGKIV